MKKGDTRKGPNTCVWSWGHRNTHILLGSRRLLRLYLALDPEVRLFQALGDADGGGPREGLLDEGVVAVAPPYPLGAGDVSDGELLALEAHRDRRKLVHAHLVRCDRQEREGEEREKG